ncbi:Na+/H+ antiporter subunit E [Archangium violaceum]|uniref:Na+/H+ antiporter subunit E n=1 Tax=Archangium violaceum TaxID=83451 RepID=UPI00193C6C09|nr:Na+/H+ antiporter subunit E [Archangium violaceum]QRK05915.1 Na+/H+ antiporter subunit E [Archangium violaceum]
MSRHLLPLLLLTGVYALMVGSVRPADLAMGALLALGLRWLFRPEHGGGPPEAAVGVMRRMMHFPRFLAAALGQTLVGSARVALLTLGLRPVDRDGEVEVPVGERSELGVHVTAMVATLSPGSVLLEVDWERRVMRFHVVDATDPDALRRELDDFYRRYQRAVFP